MATDHPLYADEHKSPQPEKWAKDGTKVDQLLTPGNNLEKARKLFAEAMKPIRPDSGQES